MYIKKNGKFISFGQTHVNDMGVCLCVCVLFSKHLAVSVPYTFAIHLLTQFARLCFSTKPGSGWISSYHRVNFTGDGHEPSAQGR